VNQLQIHLKGEATTSLSRVTRQALERHHEDPARKAAKDSNACIETHQVPWVIGKVLNCVDKAEEDIAFPCDAIRFQAVRRDQLVLDVQ